jgi:polysaccharide chain length determinant protein (PEP-CTERM system associated)
MNEQLDLLYGYLHGIWRYRWSALIIAWIFAILGWLIIFLLPDQFSVRTVVYVDTSSVLKPLLQGLTPETDSRDDLQIMTRVLLSRKNLMSVIRETDMDLEINTTEEKEALLKRLTKTIKITGGSEKKRDKNNLYEISYKSNSAKGSYQMVSNLLNTMIEDTLNSKRTDTVSAQKFLDSQILVYEERLSKAEQKLAQFKKENVGYMPDERGGYYTRLQRAKDSVKDTSSSLQLANRRYTELSKQLTGENPILSSDYYQSENAIKIKEYQSELDSLLNQYTDRHFKVQKLQAIIKNLKATPDTSYSNSKKAFNPIYQEIKVELNKARVEIEILKIQQNKQAAYVNELSASIDVIPEVEAKLAKLNRGYDVTRERYLDLVKRSESAKLAHSVGHSSNDITFRVIEPPLVPFKPSGPNRALFLSGVLLAALAAGLAWSLLRYLLQPTFIDFTQLASATDFPVLGSVNLFLSPEHRKKRRLQLSTFISATFLLVILFGTVFLLRDSGAAFFASVIKGTEVSQFLKTLS